MSHALRIIQFGLGLHDAQSVHQRRQPLIIVQRITPHRVRHEARLASLHFDDGALVFVAVQINMLALAHEPVGQARELREPVNFPNATNRAGFLLRQLVAFPQFQFGCRLAEEKNLAVLFLIGIGIHQKDGLLLFDACEVEQVRVRSHRHCAVGVSRQDVVGVDERQRVRQQQFLQSPPVGDQAVGTYRFVSHWRFRLTRHWFVSGTNPALASSIRVQLYSQCHYRLHAIRRPIH